MKLLVVFVLSWSLADGKHVQKCDLMRHLKRAVSEPQMKPKLDVASVDDLVAKIVCKTEVATGFDTSAVKELKSGQKHSQAKGRRRRSPANAASRHACTLLGLFQLASHLVCDDGVTPSANMCGTSCSNLQDDNIQDDIMCLLNVSASLGDSLFGVKTWQEDGGQMKQVMEGKCANVQASTYFRACPKQA